MIPHEEFDEALEIAEKSVAGHARMLEAAENMRLQRNILAALLLFFILFVAAVK